MIVASQWPAYFGPLKNTLYFNTAYFGPSPEMAKGKALQALEREFAPQFRPYEEWLPLPDKLRKKLAIFLKNPNLEAGIFHTSSTSEGHSHLLYSLSWKEGDLAVTIDGEYPSLVLPLMRLKEKKGVEYFLLEKKYQFASPEEIVAALPSKTRYVCLSWVSFATGRVAEVQKLGKLLKERGIFFVVDATQALGGLACPSDLFAPSSGVTALITSTYKWMLGGYGHAFVCFHPEILQEIDSPLFASWTNMQGIREGRLLDYTLASPSVGVSFDNGQPARVLLLALLEGVLDFWEKIDSQEVEDHNKKLAKFFWNEVNKQKFTPTVIEERFLGQIICLKMKSGDSDNFQKRLVEKNIDISVRDGNLRISFHLFNTLKQVHQLLEIFAS